MSLEQILQSVAEQARHDLESSARLMDEASEAHQRMQDPKARSYGWVASLVHVPSSFI